MLLLVFHYAVFALEVKPKGSNSSAQERTDGQHKTIDLHNVVLGVRSWRL